MDERWDETWHRLHEWTSGQAPSERLAAQVLSAAGYEDVDPSHPLGGRDGLKDAIAVRDGHRWVMAVYFARGQQSFTDIRNKLVADYVGVARNDAVGLVFVTNQELRLAERDDLAASVPGPLDLFHLERVVQLLDQPRLRHTRRQFLGIGDVVRSAPPDVRPLSFVADDLLVGRERELDEIEQFLRAEGDRSVYVLSGLPGGGKTALAQRAVATAVGTGHFTGGGYSVDLRGYDVDVDSAVHGHEVYAGALRALGVEVAKDDGELPAQYHAVLQDREAANDPVLILLDNVYSASQITMLLPRTRLHRIVVTSRSDIGPMLPGSAGTAVSPLPETASTRVIEAVCEAAGRPLPDEAGALVALANLCGHLPLALRVAAAILVSDRSLAPGDLIDELADETRRLDTLQYEDTAVRAVLRTSYARLGSAEARCFRYLSLHPSPELSTRAAASLLDTQEADTRRLLRRLATCHLVDSDETGRWRMHDLIRLCSSELGAEHDSPADRRDAQTRVIYHYADTVSDADEWFNASAPHGVFPTRASAMEWLLREGPAAVAAAHLAEANGEHFALWRLGMNLKRYLGLRHDFTTALTLLQAGGRARSPWGIRRARPAHSTTLASR